MESQAIPLAMDINIHVNINSIIIRRISMRKLMVLCSMLLCSAVFLPQSASAKEIKNVSAAKKLAKEKVASSTVTDVDVDHKGGSRVYEVDLSKGNREYELTYKASNGKLLKYEWELIKKPNDGNNQELTKKEIRSLAKKRINHASIQSIHFDYDDGIPEYKVKLKKNHKRYTLVYHGSTGKLLEYKWELKKYKSA